MTAETGSRAGFMNAVGTRCTCRGGYCSATWSTDRWVYGNCACVGRLPDPPGYVHPDRRQDNPLSENVEEQP
jgi:hypothetical protein